MTRISWFRGAEIHKSAYLDEAVFAIEQATVFVQSWLYLCHGSQIPTAGDYFTTELASQPLVAIRQKSGEIKVLYNRCPHKGVKVLAETCGNSGRFLRCPYHAWTFKPSGELLGIPVKTEYDPDVLSGCEASAGMKVVENVVCYRDFIFVRLSDHGLPFERFFGDSLSTLDNMIDRSPQGTLRVVGAPLRHRHHCNWKMVMDNQTDTCHPMVAHESSAGEAINLWAQAHPQRVQPMAVELFSPFMSSLTFFAEMGLRVWPNGHGHTGVSHSIHKDYSAIPGYWESMVESYGEERAQQILNDTRHNTVYFPNLMVKGPIQTLRVIRPVSASETVVESWILELIGAPQKMLERTVQYNNLINSPCSMVAHDDVEMYERATIGLKSQASEWVNIARLYEPGERWDRTSQMSGTSEAEMRNFYAMWQRMMEAGNEKS
ncbi:aromatic ring-hydroxylating dioxygenase subunit alpha [Xenorhabdus szentirmaii]|uniref:Dioxygenase hydroxylase large component n=2 Tax=Xenorhabdus szentirmaii TaxID=290112 RepID=W1J7U3_9GAMM|nr:MULTISPECIES: aromatic ring-hydroxylating dioxygenase subunit alpha [Xenorhabdus]MBD2782189.1 Rieske 2Fe-2S domain-containing protein [Xenorhabdus sp. 38]MBD2793811.1 Rieske 2Fe-2S domain-containing protein [Xenorhabdus sp. CUL]MBD2801116.1 Rieske 2Fe-2S domain-containing protein [Xenorhabdus sp. M]MBD2823895.1 Rieske 2Fe-2S domain-containing protein [Xenorhabdus sp. 5]PHM35319.1 putative iron-sulfur protein [Xenorhabdus szentirmaii DSM 16338]